MSLPMIQIWYITNLVGVHLVGCLIAWERDLALPQIIVSDFVGSS